MGATNHITTEGTALKDPPFNQCQKDLMHQPFSLNKPFPLHGDYKASVSYNKIRERPDLHRLRRTTELPPLKGWKPRPISSRPRPDSDGDGDVLDQQIKHEKILIDLERELQYQRLLQEELKHMRMEPVAISLPVVRSSASTTITTKSNTLSMAATSMITTNNSCTATRLAELLKSHPSMESHKSHPPKEPKEPLKPHPAIKPQKSHPRCPHLATDPRESHPRAELFKPHPPAEPRMHRPSVIPKTSITARDVIIKQRSERNISLNRQFHRKVRPI